MTPNADSSTRIDSPESKPSPQNRNERIRLEKQSMRNWYLLSGFCVASTTGLLFAVTPVLRGTLSSFWPWAHTDVMLIAALGGAIALLVLNLTTQQLKVVNMRNEVMELERQAGEHREKNAIRLHALLNVTRMMGALSDPVSLFQAITGTCLEVFECQQASLMLIDPGGTKLEMKAAAGHVNGDIVKNATQPIGSGIAGYVAKNREPLLLTGDVDQEQYPGLEIIPRGITAAMVVPIIVRDELVGVLNISSRSANASYSKEDLQALEVFASNAGNCILQAERTEWMRLTIEQYRKKEEMIKQRV